MKRIAISRKGSHEKGPGRFWMILPWFLFFLFSFSFVHAQVPDKISYQAILRGSDNKPVTNTHVSMRFSILQGAPDGTAVYVETQDPTSNALGLVTLQIGTGTVVSGNLTAIDWSAGPYYLKTEADPSGGTDYTLTGTSEIVSVPYALYAGKAGNVFSGDYNDLSNTPVNVSAFNNDAGYLTTEVDGDPANEIQDLKLNGNILTITRNGSATQIDLSPYLDNTDAQQLTLNDHTLSITNGNAVQLPDQVNDADHDPTNELQVLSVSHDTLYLSNGGSVVLPPDNDFTRSGNFVTTLDSVGIGTDTPHSILEVHGRITQSGINGSVVIGENAGINMTSLSRDNTLVGRNAGHDLQGGFENVALGTYAMEYSKSAIQNTAVGLYALRFCSEGDYNTAVGHSSLYANTSGRRNTAVGALAAYSNKTGSYNTACGFFALQRDTSGNQNTALGAYALFADISGYSNTASGYHSLYSNTTGHENTAIGAWALSANTTSHYNTAVGAWALSANTTGNYNTALGNEALKSNTTAFFNTAVGYSSMYSNTTGAWNTATGFLALSYNTTGNRNTATGYYALGHNTTGHDNTAMGYMALFSSTVGFNNVAIGSYALYRNVEGYNNTAAGDSSLYNNTGNNNTALGKSALMANTTGSYNTGIGYHVLHANSVSGHNVAIGFEAMTNYGDLNEDNGRNTAVGNFALRWLRTGRDNTAVGFVAGVNYYTTNGIENSTALGNHATITASNQVRIGDSFVTSIGGYAGWSNLSDGRFKTEIKAGVPGLAFIMKLRPVMYHLDLDKLNTFLQVPDSLRDREKELKREQMTETGFIAQEVEKAAKEIGYDFSGVDPPKNEHDYYNLRYAEFVVPLVKAVQEQQAEIEALKEQNKLLQQEIEALKNK